MSVSYPWTGDICKLTDILGQAIAFQSSLECNLLKDQTLLETYKAALQKFLDRWLYQNELDTTLALFHRCPIIQILGLVGLNLKVMVASGDSNPDDLISLMGEKLHGHIWRPAEDKFKCLLYLSIYLRVHLNLLDFWMGALTDRPVPSTLDRQ